MDDRNGPADRLRHGRRVAEVRRSRTPWRKLLFMLAIGAVTLLATGCTSSDPQYVSMVTTQAEIVQQAADEFGTHFSGGEFESSDYFTSDWEKYQLAAVADASLGAIPSGDLSSEQQSLQPGYRETAISTVDQAIATHQLSDGDFDDGTPSSGSSWGQRRLLGRSRRRDRPDDGALRIGRRDRRNWITSMESYSDYLWTTQLDPNTYAAWYTNGNVVLRETVILLETYLLSRDQYLLHRVHNGKRVLEHPRRTHLSVDVRGLDDWKRRHRVVHRVDHVGSRRSDHMR